MKTAKLREQTKEELQRLGIDTRKEIFDLKMKKGRGDATEQPLRIRTLRREVARIETVLNEREK